MALLWADGFDHYGTDENNLIDGVYTNIDNATLSTAHPVTGSYGIFIVGGNTNAQFDGLQLRKVLPTAIDKMGACGHFYFAGLPTVNVGGTVFDFMTSVPNVSQLSCCVDSNGRMRFVKGRQYQTLGSENGTVVATTDPIIVANANNHIEVQVYIHSSLGWIRVAVNGVHRFEATGLNTQYNTNKIVSVGQCSGFSGNAGSGNFYMDNLMYYDFTGNSAVETDFCPTTDGSGKATSYIGELQCVYLPPNGDTVEADWVPSTGVSGYAMVDETTPNDADYISSTVAGDLSEFDLTDLPVDLTYIRGLMLLGRMSKSDSGTAMTKFGMNSGGVTNDAAERPVTQEATYWWDFMNVDPLTSARWTRGNLNNAKFRLTRSV